MLKIILLNMKKILFDQKILLILVSYIFLFTNSCVEEKYDWDRFSDEIEFNPGLAAPILKGSLTLDDIIMDASPENAGKYPLDSLLYVIYADTFKSFLASDVVDIPDQTYSQLYSSSDISSNPSWIGSPNGQTVSFSKLLNPEFEVTHNEKIDSIKLILATLQIRVLSSFKQSGNLRITTNAIKINGQPFLRNIPIDQSGTFNIIQNIPLNNAMIYLDNSDPTKTVLPISFELSLIKSSNPIGIGESCTITINFLNIQFSTLYGYLGEYDLLFDDGEFETEFFDRLHFGDDIVDGEILFADPMFTLLTDNSVGIPIEVTLTNVSAYSDINDVTTPISFTGVNPFDIDAPDISHIGQFVHDSIVINKDNSNIDDAINTSPSSISYSINATTNPEGPAGPYNFVTDTSRLDLIFEMVLPLWLNAKNIILEDTSDLDLEDKLGKIWDYIENFRMKIEGTNGYPFEAALQVIFLDSEENALDSLFTGTSVILNPASVGTNGMVTSVADFEKTAELSKQRLEKIKETKKAVIRARLDTSNSGSGQYVKLFAYYKLDFKMSVKTNLIINKSLDNLFD
jgi:hypothetical protein